MTKVNIAVKKNKFCYSAKGHSDSIVCAGISALSLLVQLDAFQCSEKCRAEIIDMQVGDGELRLEVYFNPELMIHFVTIAGAVIQTVREIGRQNPGCIVLNGDDINDSASAHSGETQTANCRSGAQVAVVDTEERDAHGDGTVVGTEDRANCRSVETVVAEDRASCRSESVQTVETAERRKPSDETL